MFAGLVIIIVGLFVLLSASIGRFTGRLSFYTQQLNGQLGDLQGLLDRLGLSGVDLSKVVNSSAMVGAIGAVLSGIGGFLSSLFLILMIVLLLLSEGSAMMDRLRASVAQDNPQVARLAVIG
jgi:AI-2 transport protein TqsA